MSFRDDLREYDRMWGRGNPRFASWPRTFPLNPLARFRDWWFAPVVPRLDRIEANTRRDTLHLNNHKIVVDRAGAISAMAKGITEEVRRGRR